MSISIGFPGNIIGDYMKVPEFKLPADDGTIFDSKSLNGTWRVFFFYAKDGSPTCKRGCLTFREQYDLFTSAGCEVVGISQNPQEKHVEFAKSFQGGLPFRLLADVDREVAKSFNVPMHLGLFPAKSSFLVGPDDEIKHVYDWLFRPRRHVAKILRDIEKLRSGD